MICSFCKKNIPDSAPKCSHCDILTNSSISTIPTPRFDMYGQPVKILLPDIQKEKAKLDSMIGSVEYRQVKEAKKNIEKNHNRSFGLSFLIFIIIAFVLFPLSAILFFSLLPNSVNPILFMLLAFVFIFVLPIIFFTKGIPHYNKKNKPLEQKVQSFAKHNHKENVYFNNSIIGYVIPYRYVNTNKEIINGYTFHEIDKKDILDIEYDEDFSEYVIHILYPIYTDFNSFRTTEFRIPDIFDDTELSIALGKDLPPKTMYF